jgi:hypothetical protein
MSDCQETDDSLILEQLVDDPVWAAPCGPMAFVLEDKALAEAPRVLRDRVECPEDGYGNLHAVRERSRPSEPGGASDARAQRPAG